MRNPLPFALVIATSSYACVDQPRAPEEAQVDQADGGYSTADEAPMFGAPDEFTAAAIEGDAPVADIMASDPTVTALNGSPTVDGRDLILAWGRIPGDPTATQGRDWSGSLQVSRGALLVHRTIAFEDATDHLLPRTVSDAVSFQSFTRPFADGLALRVLDPDPTSTTPLALTYTSAVNSSITYSLDLAQLAAGPVVIDAGDGFRMVAVGLHRHDVDGCAGGFMRGRFRELTARLGVYHGVVTNRLGAPIGHVRGIYGERADGTHVMFGKFIDVQGHFLGVLVGTYDSGDFRARWKVVGDDDHGVIRGHYHEAPDATAGHFLARWSQVQCAEDQD
jgi:hypothetical protein